MQQDLHIKILDTFCRDKHAVHLSKKLTAGKNISGSLKLELKCLMLWREMKTKAEKQGAHLNGK